MNVWLGRNQIEVQISHRKGETKNDLRGSDLRTIEEQDPVWVTAIAAQSALFSFDFK